MIKEAALRYLGYHHNNIPTSIQILLDTCIKEVISIANFKHVHQIYEVDYKQQRIKDIDLCINYPSLLRLLKNCQTCLLEACTLGIEIDRKIQYYSNIDLTKMTIFDAVASSYLEYACNEWEKQIPEPHTFRFCPGYSNVPLTLNNKIANKLNTYKNIGLTVQDSGILLPQKSMIGMIGLGNNLDSKDCSSCIKVSDCSYIKRGITCYSNK